MSILKEIHRLLYEIKKSKSIVNTILWDLLQSFYEGPDYKFDILGFIGSVFLDNLIQPNLFEALLIYVVSTHRSQSLDLSLRYFTISNHATIYPHLIPERP